MSTVDWSVHQNNEYIFTFISLKFSTLVLNNSFLQFFIHGGHFPVHFMCRLSWTGNYPRLFCCHDNFFKGHIWTHCNCSSIECTVLENYGALLHYIQYIVYTCVNSTSVYTMHTGGYIYYTISRYVRSTKTSRVRCGNVHGGIEHICQDLTC